MSDEIVSGAQPAGIATSATVKSKLPPPWPTSKITPRCLADYGFGLGLAVRTTPGVVRMMGSVGQFSWPGASGTDWWVDPKEKLAVVYLSAAPGPIRWHYRQKINAMVYQAIIE
jgi:CubicO group peptidase (beta-lactamase class C family)